MSFCSTVGFVFRRDGFGADHPGVKLGIGHFDQPLEIAEFAVVEFLDKGIGETADDQVGLAYAAPPGPE